MSFNTSDIIDSAEGTIDKELLTKTGKNGFIYTGYLHNKPLIEYLESNESLEYLFDNTKKGVAVTRDGKEWTVTPDSAYRTLLAVTSRRVFCVVGCEDGDRTLEIPMDEITDAVVDTGFRKELLTIHSTLGTIEFYTRSNPETSSAAEYIRRQCRETSTEQPDAGDDTSTGSSGSGDSLSRREKMTGTIERVAVEPGRHTPDTPSPEIDPTEHEIADLTPKVQQLDDIEELEEMLVLEEDGEDRAPVKKVIEARIEDFEEDEADEEPETEDVDDETPEAGDGDAEEETDLTALGGVDEETAAALAGAGYETVEHVAAAPQDQLQAIEGVSTALAARIKIDVGDVDIDETVEPEIEEESEEEVDIAETDLSELTVADIANGVRDINDVELLEELLEREKESKERKGAITQIEDRIESVESKTPDPDTDETDGTSTEMTTFRESGHRSESGESSAGTDTSQERRQDIQAGGEGTTLEARSDLEAESSSAGTTTDGPAYVDTETVSDSTFDAMAEAESNVSRADIVGEDTDEIRQLLIRAHNSLCQVLADDQPGIDRDGIEQRIAEIEHRLDSLGTTAHLDDVATDDPAASDAGGQRPTAEDGDARTGDEPTDDTGDIPTDEDSSESPSRREKMIRTIEEVAADLCRIPKYGDMHDYGSFEAKEYSKEFTSWQEAIEATDIDIEARLIDELRSAGGEVGRAPTRSELEKHGPYDSNRYIEHFGSYDQALSAADLEKQSQDTLFAELQRVADRLGCTPTSTHVKEFGDYPVTYYRKQFGSVRNAAEEAGMDYESDVIDAIKALAIGLGHRPTTGKFNQYALYSHSYTYNFFDGWREACEAAGVGSDDAVEDVLSDLTRTEINEIVENAPVTDVFREEYIEKSDLTDESDSTDESDATDGPDSTEEDMARADEEVIIDTVKAIAIGLGQRPNRIRFTQFSEHGISDVGQHFENWTNACQAAGVNSDDAVRELRTALSQSETEELLENAALNDKFYDAHPDIGSTEGDDEQVSDGQRDGWTRETLEEEIQQLIDEPEMRNGDTGSDQSTSGEPEPSPLAEYYETFGNLVGVQQALFGEELENLDESGPMPHWHELVHDRWAGDSSTRFSQSYGAQQNERVGFKIGEYRDAYGDGDRVTDFQVIETTALPEAVVELVSSVSELERPQAAEIRIPETPEGCEPLPVLVESTAEFERAESLINKFPEQPKTGTEQRDSMAGAGDEEDSLESGDNNKDDPQAENDAHEETDDELTDIGGVTASVAEALRSAGYHTKGDLKAADKDELVEIEKVGSQTASRIKLLLGS